MVEEDIEEAFDRESDEFREPTKSDKRIKGIEDFKAWEGVFDRKTIEALEELMTRGLLREIGWVVSTGKEADVFYGISEGDEEVAIKIYRIHTSKFRKIDDYVAGDRRFGRVKSVVKQKWNWAKREFKNLKRAYSAGVSVPRPITVHRNIVVMEFIGKEGTPAPLLKDVDPAEIENPEKLFNEIIGDMEKLYKKARLVHADFSPFNILYWEGKHYVIDLAQGMTLEQDLVHKYLYRDINNIISYFAAVIEDLPDPDEIFKRITGREVDPYYKISI